MMNFVDDEILNPIQFKDEPHFQYEMLHKSISIKYKDEIYFPLVSEFPASPGIDLIYISNSRKIVLAELKYNSKQYELAQKEILHHYEKYKEKTVADIFNYAKANPYEANIDIFKTFHNK